MKTFYDIIIIGAGHAGIEAAWSAANLGCQVLLATFDIDAIGKLSCNPAIGGISKGHLVREVDALGGLIGRIADETAISYRYLNRSKGKAVWATRAQVDRYRYPIVARRYMENHPNIHIIQAKINDFLIKNKKITGIRTNFGQEFKSKAVIVTAGTFLKSTIHIGLNSFSGGRLYEQSGGELWDNLKKLKLGLGHFKTGTCARLDKRSIDFSQMTEQPGEYDVAPFSFLNTNITTHQLSCFITHTNEKTHKIIKKNLKYSPLYTGKIKAHGVRYCPSLEDKVMKFSDKQRHQIFIEPEGRDTMEIYPNGISTSLPYQAQCDFIHSIQGLENAVVLRPGYGIEHGVIDSRKLYSTLECRLINGLYCAGQINGTTGYEEAAAQGCMAGINAALKIKQRKPLILSRQQAFIGVLLDDLTAKGTNEPYRMFTSRCEFRLSVRESNADIRLTPIGFQLGLLDKTAYEKIQEKSAKIKSQIECLRKEKIIIQAKKISLYDLLKRPESDYADVIKRLSQEINQQIAQEVEINVKYEGFLSREKAWLKELKNLDKIKIPKIDITKVPSLSRETIEKMIAFKPKTLGQALAVSGITPAAIMSIYTYIKNHKESIIAR